jgi:hypothetical protein
MPNLTQGVIDGRLVVDNSAPPHDGNAYTLTEAVKPTPAPVLQAIYPTTFTIGSPDALLHTFGKGFNRESRIKIAGNIERTTFVSPSELTTWINSKSWTNPDPAVPVLVATSSGPTASKPLAIAA